MQHQNNLIIILILAILIFSTSITSYAYQNYTVQRGDSLFKISQKFNTSISTLAQINNIQNPNLIYIKHKLNIPNNKKSQSSPRQSMKAKKSNSASSSYKTTNWQKQDNVVTATKKTRTKKMYRKGSNTRKIALTFDDGPDSKYTPQILKVLRDYNVKATFFLMGERVKKYPLVVKQIIEDGHTIGNHSWSHPNLAKLNKEKLNQEIIKTETAIKEIIERETSLMRPPYGAISDELLNHLEKMNYKVIHWSIDSLDWKAQKKEEVLERTLPKLHEGAIILFHSAGGKGQSLAPTVNALPEIIETIRNKNFELVTADNLLSLSAYKG